jgi:hypothetical protein
MSTRQEVILAQSSFDMIGSNEIGRYDSTSLRFLPGFGIMITSVFHAFGIFSRMQTFTDVVSLIKAFLVRTDVSPKRRFLQEPHGITSQ